MPGPDPAGVTIEGDEAGRFRLMVEVWPEGNRRNRIARMKRIARRIGEDGWRCIWCGAPVPLYRRADAVYCREACRKAEARWRRKLRGDSGDGRC